MNRTGAIKEEEGRRFSELIRVLVDFILYDNKKSNIEEDLFLHNDHLSNYGSLVAIEIINRITNVLRHVTVHAGMVANVCQVFSRISTKNPFLIGVIQQVKHIIIIIC